MSNKSLIRNSLPLVLAGLALTVMALPASAQGMMGQGMMGQGMMGQGMGMPSGQMPGWHPGNGQDHETGTDHTPMMGGSGSGMMPNQSGYGQQHRGQHMGPGMMQGNRSRHR